MDVHLSRDERSVGVEIAIQSRPGRERQNIQKCLDSGYPRVVALFLDPGLLQMTRELFHKEGGAEGFEKVTFMELDRFWEALG